MLVSMFEWALYLNKTTTTVYTTIWSCSKVGKVWVHMKTIWEVLQLRSLSLKLVLNAVALPTMGRVSHLCMSREIVTRLP